MPGQNALGPEPKLGPPTSTGPIAGCETSPTTNCTWAHPRRGEGKTDRTHCGRKAEKALQWETGGRVRNLATCGAGKVSQAPRAKRRESAGTRAEEKQDLVCFRQTPGCEFEHQTRLAGVRRDRSSSDASSNFCECTTLRAQRSWSPLYGVWVGTHVAVGGHHELGREKDCEHGRSI